LGEPGGAGMFRYDVVWRGMARKFLTELTEFSERN